MICEGPKKGRHSAWMCECACSNNIFVHCSGVELRGGGRTSCGCATQTRLEDLTGQVFGHFMVIGRGPNIGKAPGWYYNCDCGNPDQILLRAYQMNKGTPEDCVCSNNPNVQGIYGPFIDRQTALKQGIKQYLGQGIKQYFPGSTCKQGHVAPRVTGGGECMECQRIATTKKRAEGCFREYAIADIPTGSHSDQPCGFYYFELL